MIMDELLSLILQTFLSWILRTVLIMSAAGSVLALILFVLTHDLARPEAGVISKAAQYWAWKIVLAAFLVPFSLFYSAPIYTPTSEIQNIIEETIVPNQERFDEISRSYLSADADLQRVNELRAQWWIDHLKFIPLGVSLVLFGISRFQYRVFARKLRLARLPAREEEAAILQRLSRNKKTPALYRNPLVPTAMLAGIFRPAIYLPDREYSEMRLEHILLHELTHYRRHDVLVKWFSVLLTQLHWFNPLAYLARRELNRACELSCDAAAIRDYDNRKKQEYGDTLISVAAEAKIPNSMISTAVCEEKKNLKDRLTAIMNSKKATRGAVVFSCVFVALTLCVTVVFAAAPTTKVIDPSSVISAARMYPSPDLDFFAPAMFQSVPFDSAFPEFYEGDALSEADTNTLLHLINSYRKTVYVTKPVQPTTYNLSIWIRINEADGGYYLLNRWLYHGFSFNPLHFGEDDYCCLLTYFDAEGNIGTTWKLEYDFDLPFSAWVYGGTQGLMEFEEERAAEKGRAKAWKAVVSLDDYYSVEEVSSWIEEYGITVERVYMWPEGETGRLALYVENGNIQAALDYYTRRTGEDGVLLDNSQFRKDHERLLNGEYKVFALTVIAPEGTLIKPLKALKWDIGCVGHVAFMDSDNSREIPGKPDGAL